MTVAAPVDALDAVRVLASAPALRALDRLGAALRAGRYSSAGGAGVTHDSPVARFAAGEAVAATEVDAELGGAGLGALLDAGAADIDAGSVRARFTVLGAGPVLCVVPPQIPDQGDLVYLGADSFWLLQTAWKLAAGGRRAVELGTGTGFLAAALAPRYALTLGTDILPRTVASAALTFRLNDRAAHRLVAAAADVGRGLRPGSFDLVVANAPWVPGAGADSAGRPRTYADGGPTGQELPMRFIVEGSALLAPGGVAVVQCLDLVHGDGTAPLARLCDRLRAEGLEVGVRPVGPAQAAARLNERFREAGVDVTATLVDVVIERPAGPVL